MIQELGKGKCSTVYKARNLLDNSVYAVKEILFKINNLNKKTIQDEINSVLKEVRLHASIESEHIVTFNNSWIELKLKGCKDPICYLETLEVENQIELSLQDEIIDLRDDSISIIKLPSKNVSIQDNKLK